MHPNYTLARKLIQKANEKGYNREDGDMACEYWWATRQYLDPEFAKLFIPIGDLGWMGFLEQIVVLEEDDRAEMLASFL